MRQKTPDHQKPQTMGSLDKALKDRPKVFVGGDQGWVDLKLAHVETLSPNVKKFIFEFEDPEAVSGLHIACMLGH